LAWSIACVVLVAVGCQRDVERRAHAVRAALPETPSDLDSAYPLSLRDDLGRTVTLQRRPQRIVTLLPSHTETVFALGAGRCVVGVDDFSDEPPEVATLPKLGGQFDTPLELLHSLAPDLVLASEAASSVRALEGSGLIVWAGSARRFDDVFRIIDVIGQLIGRRSEGARLVERMRAQIDGVAQEVGARERVRVYYELDPSPYTVGPSSFIGVMLAKAGGDNIVPTEFGEFPKINPEFVVSSDPSVILGASLDEVSDRPGWATITAVRAARVYKLAPWEAALVARPGPRLAAGLRALVRRLHPEAAL